MGELCERINVTWVSYVSNILEKRKSIQKCGFCRSRVRLL